MKKIFSSALLIILSIIGYANNVFALDTMEVTFGDFLIGDFNEWKIPAGEELNGAIPMPVPDQGFPTCTVNANELKGEFCIYSVHRIDDGIIVLTYYGADPDAVHENYETLPDENNNSIPCAHWAVKGAANLSDIIPFKLITENKDCTVGLQFFYYMDLNVTNAHLALGAETGISEIIDNDSSKPEYFTISGIKIANPEKGIYIKKTGNKTEKIIL